VSRSRVRKTKEPEKKRNTFWIGVGVVCLFGLQALLALPYLSATSDEPIHLVGGYSYWQTRDFRINPEHPPLAKLLASLPLLAIKPTLDTSSDDWKNASENRLGFTFLYGSDADRLLFWARVPMIALATLGGFITFLWARDLFGAMAGIFAASLYSFCPNLLAHGMLITTDVPVGTFTLLTLYLLWKQGNSPNWLNSLVIGLSLGAAMTSKYSGGLLPVLVLGLAVVRAFRQDDRKQALVSEARNLMVMAAACIFVIEAAYLFSASPLLYFTNSAVVNANHNRNYEAYLLGQLKPGGWWYYFLVAFVFKATLATLIFLVLAAINTILSAKSHGRKAWGQTILLSGIIFYTIAYSAEADNLGVRYLLPIFPLLYVWISQIVPVYWNHSFGRVALGVLLAWHMWAALSTFPNYIPYFNELAGGAASGPDFLDDSNVDWGESLKETAWYVKEKRIDNLILCPFSAFMNPEYYGLHSTVRPPKQLVFNKPAPGTYIISAHNIAWMKAVDAMWRNYRPIDRIGGMWVYRF
jgi:hypothetical protein